jgi:hypothetical protein
VNVSAHNNESGQYRTDVYLYDNLGNTSAFATTGANVPLLHGIPRRSYAENEIITYAGLQWIVVYDLTDSVLLILYDDIGRITNSSYCGTTAQTDSYLSNVWAPTIPVLYSDLQAGYIYNLMVPLFYWFTDEGDAYDFHVNIAYPVTKRIFSASNGDLDLHANPGYIPGSIGRGLYSTGGYVSEATGNYIWLTSLCEGYIRPAIGIYKN